MAAALDAQAGDIRMRMDRMYRPQKRIYDFTRRYYLLGRDRLIAELDLREGQSLLDIGCGTGRNLALIGRRYPATRLYGLDAAEPMLEVAAAKLKRGSVRAVLAHGIAEGLEPRLMLGHEGGFDHITISYCLSMVNTPDTVLRSAARHLRPGGALHVVDFGDMSGLPGWTQKAMRAWLARFHVRHRPEVEATLRGLAAERGGRFEQIEILGRYSLLLRLRLRPA